MKIIKIESNYLDQNARTAFYNGLIVIWRIRGNTKGKKKFRRWYALYIPFLSEWLAKRHFGA